MGLSQLSNKGILGYFYARLESFMNASWASLIAGDAPPSDQETESYKFTGQVPPMSVKAGAVKLSKLNVQGLTLTNVKYQTGLRIEEDERRRDKTGQIQRRIDELAVRAGPEHWEKLLSALIDAGTGAVGYDNEYFFDSDHSDKGAAYTTSQSNLVTSDIDAIGAPSTTLGTTTVPSDIVMALSIVGAIAKMRAFKDDQGEPTNSQMQEIIAMFPATPIGAAGLLACNLDRLGSGYDNPVKGAGLKVTGVINPRLTWTDAFALFRKDYLGFPALIRQEEYAPRAAMLAEGSDFWFNEDAVAMKVQASRNVGYGNWRNAIRIQLV